MEQWGRGDEAMPRRAFRVAELQAAAKVLRLLSETEDEPAIGVEQTPIA